MKILITGGAGYIGSITATALEGAGHTPVVLDSLVAGRREFTAGRHFYHGDINDRALLQRVVGEHPDIDSTIHMAAQIVVPESIEMPYEYYENNVAKSLTLFDELSTLGKSRIIFSSSAAVYAPTSSFEVFETSTLGPASPYARTKGMMESILFDMSSAGRLQSISLRYFNPIGSDPQLRSGMYVPQPSHVLGQMVLAARGQIDAFTLTGTDLPTRDGSGLRDYVHVWDIALAHVAAVEGFDRALIDAPNNAVSINLGTGRGITVRELLRSFEAVAGLRVPVREAPSRPGDAVGAYANVDLASRLLGWRSELSVEDGIESTLAWVEKRAGILGAI